MESKKAQYKARGKKGLGDRGVRAQLKGAESRARREDLLNSKRKIVPAEAEGMKGNEWEHASHSLQLI